MKRLLLLALLAVACDDPAVAAKASDILAHGVVAAQARCSCTLLNDLSDAENGITVTAQKLIDGSCLISESSVSSTKLCSRVDSCAADCSGNGLSLASGVITHVASAGAHGTFHADITTCCTGFNLEAFGVE